MMRLPAVWPTNLVALLVGLGMFATFAFLPALLQTPTSAGYGFSASVTQSGLFLLPSTLAIFVIGQFSGKLTARYGARMLVVTGSTIGAASMAIIGLAHSFRWEMYLASALMGIGFGLAFSAMSALIVIAVPAEQTGVASGMNANIRTIGGSVGAAVMATIVTSHLQPSGLPAESGYVIGFVALAGGLVLAALAGLRIPVGRPQASTADAPHAELAIVAGGTVVGFDSE
jgi:MFS family permease